MANIANARVRQKKVADVSRFVKRMRRADATAGAARERCCSRNRASKCSMCRCAAFDAAVADVLGCLQARQPAK